MEFLVFVVIAIVSAAVGGVVAYVYIDRRCKAARVRFKRDVALAEQRVTTLSADLQSREQRSAKRDGELTVTRTQLSDSHALSRPSPHNSPAPSKNIREQRKLLDDANQQMTQAFAAVWRNALEKSNLAFIQMAEAKFKTLSTEAAGTLDEREQIGTLLKPLEEMLGSYQKRLAEMEAQRTGAYAELRQQIGVMSATQAALSTPDDAARLGTYAAQRARAMG